MANIGHRRTEVPGSHGSGRLRCFDVVSAAAAEHGILVCLGAAKSATKRGKPMLIDRLITFGQDKADV